MLDRTGIHIQVPRVDYEKLSDKRMGEPSHTVRERKRQRTLCHSERYRCQCQPKPGRDATIANRMNREQIHG
jgi:hypothetical protein